MPSRKDGRIEKGQKLATAISARAWNRAQQAADVVLGVQPGSTVPQGSHSLPYHWVYAWIPVDVEYGDCIRLEGFWSGETPEGRTVSDEVLMRPIPVLLGTLSNDSETGHESYSGYGIAVEPIQAQTVGRVAVAGVVACNVYCKKAWHAYARPGVVNGESRLVSSSFGNMQILFWHAQYSDTQAWNQQRLTTEGSPAPDVNEEVSALVRIGNTSPFQLITVTLPGNWTKNTARTAVSLGSYFSDGIYAGSTIQNPQDGYYANGGTVEVFNPWCDIAQGGTGVCARFANKWILVNWSPIEVDGQNNDTYFVPASKSG